MFTIDIFDYTMYTNIKQMRVLISDGVFSLLVRNIYSFGMYANITRAKHSPSSLHPAVSVYRVS